MKRLSMILLALLMAIVMVGCGSGEKAAEETVTVSLPRELLGSQSDEEIIANGEEEDMEVVIKETENGTRVVYTMSKETQDALLLAYKNHFEETLSQEMAGGKLPGVEDVTYTDDMSEFSLLVDRAIYEQNMYQMDMNLFFVTGTTYQFYNGGEEDSMNVVVLIKDKDSEQVIGEINMRDTVASEQATTED